VAADDMPANGKDSAGLILGSGVRGMFLKDVLQALWRNPRPRVLYVDSVRIG
jgi:hypothetical protein